MSLINTMLRDLEQRRASELGQRDWQREIRTLPPVPRRVWDWRLYLPWGIVLLLLLGGGLYWLRGGQSRDADPLPVLHQLPQAASEKVAPTFVAAPLAPPLEPLLEAPAKPVKETRSERRARLAAEKKSAETNPEKGLEKPVVAKNAPVSASPEKPALRAAALASDGPGRDAVLPSKDIVKTVASLSPREKAEALHRQAQGLSAKGLPQEALTAWQSALQEDAAFHPARQSLYRMLLDQQRPDEATRILAEGVEAYPSQHVWAMLLARQRVEKGDLAGAAQWLARSQTYAANHPDYAGFQGHVELRLNHPLIAEERYRQAVSLAPQEGKWWFGLAQSLEASGKSLDAREAYRRALAAGNLPGTLQAMAEQKAH